MNQIIRTHRKANPWLFESRLSVKALLISFGLLFIILPNNKILASPFAELVTLIHACGGEGGVAEFEILGNSSEFTWYWVHGPTDLLLEDLDPGSYTFVVKNIFSGCAEEYDVQILDKDLCEASFDQEELNFCWVALNITFTHNNVVVPEEDLNITWSDGASAGLSRTVKRTCEGTTTEYCVTVTLANMQGICCVGGGACCEFQFCFSVEGRRSCCIGFIEEMIVNEFNRSENGEDQFVELLVFGNGVCGETTDIRGFQIDDNDGLLIAGNSLVNFFNKEEIGINSGYLIFSHHPNWEAVPNGSLIVIYPPGGHHPSVPAEDPTDDDGNGVYVLPVNNSELLIAREGVWDDEQTMLEDGGNLNLPNWDKVNISPNADGVQVRWEDGSFMHGMSTGKTTFSIDNGFSLWISDASSTSTNCRFIGQDYLMSEDFSCDLAEANLQSPGLPNSTTNADLINALKDCGENNSPLFPNVNTTKKQLTDRFKVFPNPFTKEIILNFEVEESGEVNVVLFSISGQRLFEEDWICNKGKNTHEVAIEMLLPPGVLILQFTYPSGEKINKRLVQMESP